MCSSWRWWYAETFRWPEFEFFQPSSVFRWTSDWNLAGLRRLSFDFSIMDDVVWAFVTLLESLALLSLICYFFLFCGCTL